MTQTTPESATTDGLSRRRVAAAAAWAAPTLVVGAAAPALAASPCPSVAYTLDWGTNTYTRTSGTQGKLTPSDPAGAAPPISVTVDAAYTGNMKSGAETGENCNLTVEAGVVGGIYAGGLTILQSQTGTYSSYQRNARGTYTFSFTANGRPVAVKGLTFTITDIDSQSGDFWDAVELSGAFTVTSRGSTVIGSATEASPAKQSGTSNPLANSSSSGNITVTYAGPITGVHDDVLERPDELLRRRSVPGHLRERHDVHEQRLLLTHPSGARKRTAPQLATFPAVGDGGTQPTAGNVASSPSPTLQGRFARRSSRFPAARGFPSGVPRTGQTRIHTAALESVLAPTHERDHDANEHKNTD